MAKGYQGTGQQVKLTVQPRQPLPGILDFGLAGVGVLLLEPNLTSHLDTNYHPERWDKAKSVPRVLIKPAKQKRSFS